MDQTLSHSELHAFHEFGLDLISRTRKLVLDLWVKQSFHSELKADNSPVSEVDLKCEELVREEIRVQFPAHGIVGEELGSLNEHSDFVWTIDPIDGTQNLINRIPTFGTILSLLFRGRPVLGWIDHPVLGEMVHGGPAIGTWHNNEQIRISDLEGNVLGHNDLVGVNTFATFSHGGHVDVLWKVLRYHPHVRTYYDVYSHTLAILGSLAVHVEYNLKIWDCAATQALIEGAGGKYEVLGSSHDAEMPKLYNAVFGKPRAVDLLARAINSP